MSNVQLLVADDLIWPFHPGDRPEYRYRVDDDAYFQRQAVDPFPCYTHDPFLVAELLEDCQRVYAVDPAPVAFVLSHEPLARTNGWAEPGRVYDGEAKAWVAGSGTIVLAGKRIPLHPAMTRYLVAHEYGHHVEYAIERRRGEEPGAGAFIREYAEARGLTEHPCYGGGTWHITPGEVFANDFRILVADAEPEFWPHPDVDRPEDCEAICEWWARELAACRG